jgi:CheY-like chemotaxis protein
MRSDSIRPARILVVADDAELCARVAEILEGAGHDVAIEWRAEQALELIRYGARFAVVIVDLDSPGVEFAQRLQRKQADLRIVFLTTGVQPTIPEIPTAGFLSKPILPQALLKAVELTLERRG